MMVVVKPEPGAPMKVAKEVERTGAGVGTLTSTYVIVEAPAPRMPPVVVTIVEVKPIEPEVCVEVARTGAGVGTLTRTYVIVEAPTPRRPPVVATTVEVKPMAPEVCVEVDKTAQKGRTLFKQMARSLVTALLSTPLRKQGAAMTSPK
jgi:hypothetical protein